MRRGIVLFGLCCILSFGDGVTLVLPSSIRNDGPMWMSIGAQLPKPDALVQVIRQLDTVALPQAAFRCPPYPIGFVNLLCFMEATLL